MNNKRRLFCEISPLCYQLSVWKCILLRKIADLFSHIKFAYKRGEDLPYVVYSHKSLIRRKLGNVNPLLQDNKAVNLELATPHIDKILIRPNETFSLWRLIGSISARKGYRNGLMIRSGGIPVEGIGGGLCQLSNLIHWMVLHSPLVIVEHHHHDGIDMFPDYGRQVPFGVGTSIAYNYIDYRFTNPTDKTFQLRIWCDSTYLNGELLCDHSLPYKYHIVCQNEFFSREGEHIYRNNEIYRYTVDKRTGEKSEAELIKKSHAKVLYDESFINSSIR